MLVGIAVTVAMWEADGNRSFWWGLVIIAWGVGRLLGEYRDGAGTPPQAGSGGPAAPGSTFNC